MTWIEEWVESASKVPLSLSNTDRSVAAQRLWPPAGPDPPWPHGETLPITSHPVPDFA